jgi:glycosyltransferase involved in cell wall biosynthesis
MHQNSFLILIPYSSDIGFAIGRLVQSFHRAAATALGSERRVIVCFSEVVASGCQFLAHTDSLQFGANVYSNDSAAVEKLCQLIRTHRIATVLALDLPVQGGFLGAIRRAGVSRVISYWGAPISSLNHGLRLLAKQIEVRLFRRNRPDVFVFESNAMQQLAVSGRGLPAKDTRVIPTGTDTSHFRPRDESAREVYDRFGIPYERNIIVFMGHFHERKGVLVLLRAADILVSERGQDQLHFLFLGTREHEVEALRGHFGPAVGHGHVTFGGYQSDVPELLSGCMIGCIPSNGWDSFPMSALEMQSCGLPLVVSDLQGVPETIEDTVTGLVFPSGDPVALADRLAHLGVHEGLRKRMGEAARARIERHFTTEQHIVRLVELVRRVHLNI